MHTPSRRAGTRAISALITAVAVLLVIVACGGSSTTSGGSPTTGSGGAGSAGAPAAANTIMIKDFKFAPGELTVSPGAKIMVMNQDAAVHTVTADDKAFDTGNIAGGQSGEFTAPSMPGSYPFVCTPHQYMTGTLVVK